MEFEKLEIMVENLEIENGKLVEKIEKIVRKPSIQSRVKKLVGVKLAKKHVKRQMKKQVKKQAEKRLPMETQESPVEQQMSSNLSTSVGFDSGKVNKDNDSFVIEQDGDDSNSITPETDNGGMTSD
jgi:hypothetical protein